MAECGNVIYVSFKRLQSYTWPRWKLTIEVKFIHVSVEVCRNGCSGQLIGRNFESEVIMKICLQISKYNVLRSEVRRECLEMV